MRQREQGGTWDERRIFQVASIGFGTQLDAEDERGRHTEMITTFWRHNNSRSNSKTARCVGLKTGMIDKEFEVKITNRQPVVKREACLKRSKYSCYPSRNNPAQVSLSVYKQV